MSETTIEHTMDDSELCAWCGNFVCCMDATRVVRDGRRLYCDEGCEENDVAAVRAQLV